MQGREYKRVLRSVERYRYGSAFHSSSLYELMRKNVIDSVRSATTHEVEDGRLEVFDHRGRRRNGSFENSAIGRIEQTIQYYLSS